MFLTLLSSPKLNGSIYILAVATYVIEDPRDIVEFLKNNLFLLYMLWCFSCIYVCVRMPDPLELEV